MRRALGWLLLLTGCIPGPGSAPALRSPPPPPVMPASPAPTPIPPPVETPPVPVAAAPPPAAAPVCHEPEATLVRDDGLAMAAGCDARHVAVLEASGRVQRINLPATAELTDATWQDRPIELAFSPDGSYLAVLRVDGLRLWSMETGDWALKVGAGPRVLSPAGDAMVGVSFHPRRPLVAVFPRTRINRFLAQKPPTGGVRVYDLVTGVEVAHLRDAGHIQQVVWHPDGTQLVVGGGVASSGRLAVTDERLRVWHLATQSKRRELEGHTIHFSRDGRLAAIERGVMSYARFGVDERLVAGVHVDLRGARSWAKLATAAGGFRSLRRDGLELILRGGWRGSELMRWRPGLGRPKSMFNDPEIGPARSAVSGEHGAFVVHHEAPTLQRPGQSPALVPELEGILRIKANVVVGGRAGERSRDHGFHHLGSGRTVEVWAAMVDDACQLAATEPSAHTYVGDRAAMIRGAACSSTSRPSRAATRRNTLLLDVTQPPLAAP